MSERDILCELLTRGVAPHTGVGIPLLNKKLRNLKYEAVLWYDKSCVVLRNLDETNRINHPWRQQLVGEALKIIEAIIKDELDMASAGSEALDILEEKMWIDRVGSGFELGKRFLVQNGEYLMSVSDRYRKCKLCEFLVKDAFSHHYCEDFYKNEVRSQRENL